MIIFIVIVLMVNVIDKWKEAIQFEDKALRGSVLGVLDGLIIYSHNGIEQCPTGTLFFS